MQKSHKTEKMYIDGVAVKYFIICCFCFLCKGASKTDNIAIKKLVNRLRVCVKRVCECINGGYSVDFLQLN